MILYVIDADSSVRCNLHGRLQASGVTVWPFARAEDFLAQVADLPAGPIMADLPRASGPGPDLLEALASRAIRWPTIVMTAQTDIATVVAAMKHGAIEVLAKPLQAERLYAALNLAFALLASAARKTSRQQAARLRLERLTTRERSVVSALITGKTNRVIAEELAISTRTVEGHRAGALRKFGVRSIAEMVYVAVDGGVDLRSGDGAALPRIIPFALPDGIGANLPAGRSSPVFG